LKAKILIFIGANATGKTTVFDAFKWLFFDKDSNDRKDFNIKTLDSNNNPIHFLEHEVESTLLVDGKDMTFKKLFQEKWVKKRGQEDQTFSGHETSYWIDEVPVKKKEYEEKINNLIPENLFKLITDPLFFNNNMSWQARRELLVNISRTNITDEEILNSNEQFSTLQANLQGRNVQDYKKVINAKIKELNDEKEKIPVRIDELTNTLITEHDINYSDLENERELCIEELRKIDTELTDIQSRAKENMKKADALAAAKTELHNLKFRLEVENSNKYSSEKIQLDNKKSTTENEIRILTNEKEIKVTEIKKLEEENKELRIKWEEINKETLTINEEEFICPVCHRQFEKNVAEEKRKELLEKFEQQQKYMKNSINEKGQANNKRVEELNLRITEINEKLSALNDELLTINVNLSEYSEKTKEVEFDITAVPEYKQKEKEIEKLQEEVNMIVQSDTTEIQDKRSAVLEQINNINKKLNERDIQEKTKSRIEELETEEKEISQKIQNLEAQQYQIEEFTKIKVELLENTINSNFEVVKFRLFDTQINGGLVECCDTLVNGVPFADVNNAHKILAGLDIIKTLSKFYNITAPIFIDNRESINNLCNIDAQIINLIVTNDPKLRIEVVQDV